MACCRMGIGLFRGSLSIRSFGILPNNDLRRSTRPARWRSDSALAAQHLSVAGAGLLLGSDSYLPPRGRKEVSEPHLHRCHVHALAPEERCTEMFECLDDCVEDDQETIGF